MLQPPCSLDNFSKDLVFFNYSWRLLYANFKGVFIPNFLSLYTGTERVELPPELCSETGFWVALKECLTNDESAEAEQVLFRPTYRAVNGVAETSSRMDSVGYNRVRVLRSIADWNLTDANGGVLPITLDSIKMLPQKVFAFLAEHVNRLNSPMQPEEEKKFRDDTGQANEWGQSEGSS